LVKAAIGWDRASIGWDIVRNSMQSGFDPEPNPKSKHRYGRNDWAVFTEKHCHFAGLMVRNGGDRAESAYFLSQTVLASPGTPDFLLRGP